MLYGCPGTRYETLGARPTEPDWKLEGQNGRLSSVATARYRAGGGNEAKNKQALDVGLAAACVKAKVLSWCPTDLLPA
jgi:hypothetical protein